MTNQYNKAVQIHVDEIIKRAKSILAIVNENDTGNYDDEFIILTEKLRISIKEEQNE